MTRQIGAGIVPSPGPRTIDEWRQRLTACTDEAVCDIYQRAESMEERFKVLASLSVAVLHDRYRLEVWPEAQPYWWPKDKPYPPSQPF